MRRILTSALGAWERALLLGLCAAMLCGVWAQGRQRALAGDLIRLHVVAASDSPGDQAVKLAVRDAVLSLAGEALDGASGPEEAEELLRRRLPELARTASEISGGQARASLGQEYYPTREYETFSLPAGRYTSLRITLGEGGGRNWWCVVYPPLCVQPVEEVRQTASLTEDDIKLITGDGEGYVIRFRILEWWNALAERWDKKAQSGG